MSKPNIKLTRYEEIVKLTVEEVLEPYTNRYLIESGDTSLAGWGIVVTPKNSKAAIIDISNIDKWTIYMAIDNLYFLEFHLNEKDYRGGLKEFRSHVEAIVLGRIKGYRVKGTDFTKNPYIKTVIEFELSDHITPWSRNVIFRNRFKKRGDVIERQYEPY